MRQKYQTVRINHTNYDYFFSHENNIYTVYYLDQAQIILHFKHKATSLKNNIIQNLNSIKTMLTHHPLKARYQDILDIRVLATDNDDYLKIAFHPRYLPLILVKNYIYETQDWKMSAWIISRLFDTALLLQNNDLNFTGCDVNLVFVDTVSHYIIDLSALFFSSTAILSLSLDIAFSLSIMCILSILFSGTIRNSELLLFLPASIINLARKISFFSRSFTSFLLENR